jgi:capsular polysaccharide biosynthesis protein
MLDTAAVYLEEYTFQEQIQLFTDADVVVGAHGSGLCHLIWCTKGTQVVEIFAGNDPRKRIFESLSKLCGFNYTRFECSDEDTTEEPIDISPILSKLAITLSSS